MWSVINEGTITFEKLISTCAHKFSTEVISVCLLNTIGSIRIDLNINLQKRSQKSGAWPKVQKIYQSV